MATEPMFALEIVTPQAAPRALISTVSADQHEILRNVARLYAGGQFDCDPTFGRGSFYRHGVPEPRLKFDLHPRRPDVVQADCRNLPLDSASLGSIVYDPPFMHAPGKESVNGQRFSTRSADERSQRSLRELYFAAMAEFHRVLRPGGALTFKCQDTIESGKQVMTHCYVWQEARRLGFVELDLFILVSEGRMIGWNHRRQVHARKFHCYFWVFQRDSRR
jgi:hypothetical protein